MKVTNQKILSFMFTVMVLIFFTSCENNSPEGAESFVETSVQSSDQAPTGNTGDVGNSAITFLPAFKDFGDLEIGEKSPEQVITLFNSSDYAINLGKIWLTNSIAYTIVKTDCPFEKEETLASGKSCRVYFQFNPVAGGTARGKVKLTYGLGVENASQFSSGADFTGSGVSNLVFAGIGEIKNIKGNSVEIYWTHIVGAHSYFIYSIDEKSIATLVGTVVAPEETFTVKKLKKATKYKFRVKAIDPQGIADANLNDAEVTTLSDNSPTIVAVNPNAGPIGGGQTVKILGSDFVNGVKIKIGSVFCASVQFYSSEELDCVTAAAGAGTFDVTAINPDGQDEGIVAAYTYQAAPTITAVSPSSATWKGGTEILISGTGFVKGIDIQLGTQSCTKTTWINASSVSCITPKFSGGPTGGYKVNVTATNTDGQIGTLTDGFAFKFTSLELIAGVVDPRGCYVNQDPTLARIDTPYDIASDGTYLYVAARASNMIIKVDPTDGSSTVFAGQPCRSTVIDGTAETAYLQNPNGLTILGSYLYFTEYNAHVIRRVHLTTRAVSTIAGGVSTVGSTDGVGSAARFYNPWDIESDGTFLYVSDYNNYRVRKIDVSTFAVTTFAGSTYGYAEGTGAAAQFRYVSGLAYDSGFLYVSDMQNHIIRRINVATGTTSLYAGIPGSNGNLSAGLLTSNFSNPYGIMISGNQMYVTSNAQIRVIDMVAQTVSTLTGAWGAPQIVDGAKSIARLYYPIHVYYLGGKLYFTDQGNILRYVNVSDGSVATLLGKYNSPYYAGSHDGTGLYARFAAIYNVLHHQGYIYIADYNNHVVRRYDLNTKEVISFTGLFGNAGGANGFGTSARHNGPMGLAAYGDYLYITEIGSHIIRKVHIPTKEVTTIAGAYGAAAMVDDPIGTNARFNAPYYALVDSSGTYLYISDTSNHRIRRLDLSTNAVTTFAGSVAGAQDGIGTTARMNGPQGLVIVGNKMYSAGSDNYIREIDMSTAYVTHLNVGGTGYQDSTSMLLVRFNALRAIASDERFVYLADYNNSALRAMNIVTREVTSIMANLLPRLIYNSGPKPDYVRDGEFAEGANTGQIFGVTYVPDYGLVVSDYYGVFLVH